MKKVNLIIFILLALLLCGCNETNNKENNNNNENIDNSNANVNIEHTHNINVNWNWGEEDVTVEFDCDCDDFRKQILLAQATEEVIKYPTCTEKGEKIIYGKVMFNNTLYKNQITKSIPSLGHDFIFHNEVSSTCETDGHNAYNTCSRCDYSSYSKKEKLGHNYEKVEIQELTCLHDGIYKYVCKNNPNHEYFETIKTKGHSYGEWNIMSEVTCDTDGVKKRKCISCGKEETIVEEGGHLLNELCKCTRPGCNYYVSVGLSYILKDDYYEVVGIGSCKDEIIIIPDKYNDKIVKSISAKAFENKKTITMIELPDTIEYIGDEAFSYCQNLEYIFLPRSISYIGSRCFESCKKLTICYDTLSNVEYGDYWNNGYRGFYGGCKRNNYFKTEELRYIILDGDAMVVGYNDTLKEVIIPEKVTYNGKEFTVTKIGDHAFNLNTNNKILTSVTMPDTIVEIGYAAFSMCEKVENYKLSKNLKIIGESAFNYNNSLFSIILPESLVEVGKYAFLSCQYIGNIYIPKSVMKIGDMAFSQGCFVIHCAAETKPSGWSSDWCKEYNTSKFVYWGENINYVKIDGLFYTINGSEAMVTGNDGNVTNATIRGSVNISGYSYPVTSIARYSFMRNKSVKNLEISETITSIDNYALAGMKSIESLTIPFLGSTPDDTSNGYLGYAFGANSYSSNNYDVPESLKKISLTYSGALSQAFIYCKNIEEVYLLGNITSLGSNCFTSCEQLSKVVLPSSLTSISQYAFSKCVNLETIIIPKSVITMSYGVFNNCDKLTIYCESTIQPTGWDSKWNSYGRPVIWNYNK